MTSLQCVLSHGSLPDGKRRTKLATVGQLCDWHREELDRLLTEILELIGSGVDTTSEAGERARTKKAHYPPPVDLGWMALFDRRNSATVHVDPYHNWDESMGTVTSNGADIPDVFGELNDLLDECNEKFGKRGQKGRPFTALPLHHDNIAGDDILTHYRDTLKRHLRALRQVTRQPSMLLPKAVVCPITLEGVDCGGRTRKHERGIKCIRCGRLWESKDLLRLGLMIEGTG